MKLLAALAVLAVSTPVAAGRRPSTKPVAVACVVPTESLRLAMPQPPDRLRFSDDGVYVIGIFATRAVVWSRTGKEVAVLEAPAGQELVDVVLSADAKTAFMSSTDGEARWMRESGAHAPLRGAIKEMWVRAAGFPSGQERWKVKNLGMLEVAAGGKELFVWRDELVDRISTADGRLVGRFGARAMQDYTVMPSGDEVITSSGPEGVQRESLVTRAEPVELRGATHDRTWSQIAITPDGGSLVTLNYGTVEVRALPSLKKRWSFNLHDGASIGVHGGRLFSTHFTEHGDVLVIHRLDGKYLGHLPLDNTRPFAVTRAGDAIAVVMENNKVVVRELGFPPSCKAGRKPREYAR